MRTQISYSRARRGVALIIAMIFLIVFASLAVSMAAMSGASLQISNNQRDANIAFTATESGVEVFRYWLSDISVPQSLSPSERLTTVANNLQTRLTDAEVSNISTSYNGSEITISSVNLETESNQSFTASIQQTSDDTLQLAVTGTNGQINRTIHTDFNFVSRANPVFSYGVATKGPLEMVGNTGLETGIEASVYIGGEGIDYALTMEGNTEISGTVSISNAYADVSLSNNAEVGGLSGEEAIENNISIGVDEIEFPVPDVSSFEQYVQNIVDADTDTSTDLDLDNIRIVAETNPTFAGHVTLRGIVFIEQPNIVTFTGNASVTGIIIGDGDAEASSELNQVVFSGNVNAYGVSDLPDEEQFAELKTQTGSFLLAPGFSVSFSGNTNIDNGAIVANGISFSGNAGGTINGTIMNYSQDEPMSLHGNSNLVLNASDTTSNPAGFTPAKVLEFASASYSEIH